jgi:hypothetical protein
VISVCQIVIILGKGEQRLVDLVTNGMEQHLHVDWSWRKRAATHLRWYEWSRYTPPLTWRQRALRGLLALVLLAIISAAILAVMLVMVQREVV